MSATIRLFLFMFLFGTSKLLGQSPSQMIIKEDKIKDAKVIWEKSLNFGDTFLTARVKFRNLPPKYEKSREQSASGSLGNYNSTIYISRSLNPRLNSIRNVLLKQLSAETIDKLLEGKTQNAFLVTTCINKDGYIYDARMGIFDGYNTPLTSQDIYNMLSYYQKNVKFEAMTQYRQFYDLTYCFSVRMSDIREFAKGRVARQTGRVFPHHILSAWYNPADGWPFRDVLCRIGKWQTEIL